MRARTSKKERKRLFLITVAIISLLFILVGSVYSDWKQILKNRRLESELSLKYEILLADEVKLNSEIVKLQDDEYLARYAKEKFMLSAEGDTIIKLEKDSK